MEKNTISLNKKTVEKMLLRLVCEKFDIKRKYVLEYSLSYSDEFSVSFIDTEEETEEEIETSIIYDKIITENKEDELCL